MEDIQPYLSELDGWDDGQNFPSEPSTTLPIGQASEVNETHK